MTVGAADLRAALPQKTTVLEASAGTGKTYTIAGLVTRYLAEGEARIEELLVVTFGRAATSELRSRVRERLQSTRDALAKPLALSSDPVVALLAVRPDVEVCRQRLTTALAAFDSATVATTHSFCEQVLRSLGTLGDLDPGTEIVDNLDDLVGEVTDDLYLQFAGYSSEPLPFSRATGLELARAVVYDPEALLLPDDREPSSPAGLRVRFASAAAHEVDRRKREQRLMSYDDLLDRVRSALVDPETAEAARARLRERYRVVLVDEFQDTDPVQWEILRSAFHGHRTLVIIGDPKQAIYAFRGADVRSYLTARAEADVRQTLDTNWRSDARVLAGLGTLLRGAALGDPEIVVSPVEAGHPDRTFAEDAIPVTVRLLTRDRLRADRDGVPYIGGVRDAVAADAAQQVVEMLRAREPYHPRDAPARPLVGSDIAVLVRTTAQANQIRSALLAVGVPCVLTGTSSVFATPAARDWVLLLEAIEQPHRKGRVRRAALTSLLGSTAEDLDGQPGARHVDGLAQQLRSWAEVLTARGVAGLFASLAEDTDLARRTLRFEDGDRSLTDLRHVAEILHVEGQAGQLGLAGLLSWLRARVDEATGTGAKDSNQERSRRLDTDRAAVKVFTVHASKGLEFPVVLVPFAWDAFSGGSREQLPRGHRGGQRTLFLAGKDDRGYLAACAAEERDSAGEELRLLYVAMTRAIGRLLLWWAPSTKTDSGPLHRLLLAPDPLAIPERISVPTDQEVLAKISLLAGDLVAVQQIVRPLLADRVPQLTTEDAALLDVASFDRKLDREWRRTSYSWLTRDAHDAPPVMSEPDVEVKDDESDEVVEGLAPPGVRISAWSDLAGGTAFGTLVHAILEAPSGDLRAAVQEQVARVGSAVDPDLLEAALKDAVGTPLGPLAGNRALSDIAESDQLKELDFELPLAGGDDPVASVAVRQIADLLREHLSPADPVYAYAQRLAVQGLGGQVMRGFLTGSIDVVLRVDGRYLVVDHKTNRLAPHDVPITDWHYRREAMDRAMLVAHYPLQALLYSVAVHRFLRWRQPCYDPDVHLGGVLYLFLRGMSPETGDAGVWSWQPPGALVVALSELMAHG